MKNINNNINENIVLALLLFVFLSLSGCSDDSNSSYEGAWYYQLADLYLEIKSDGSADFRTCTIHEGYKVIASGSLNGNRLDFPLGSANLSRSNNILTISDTASGGATVYTLASSVPSVCINDAMEITFVSPLTATEGIMTSFIVNFDYRLSSGDAATVDLTFNTEVVDRFRVVGAEFVISQAGLGSGSLTADVIPKSYISPDSFRTGVFMAPSPKPTSSFRALASDRADISVTPASIMTNEVLTSTTTTTSNESASYACQSIFSASCVLTRN